MWNYSSLNCGSPRKRFVEVEISFDYPNKQEIKRIFSPCSCARWLQDRRKPDF
jgi:hypothetical protein